MTDEVFQKFHASGNEFLIRFWDESREGPLDEVQGSEWARVLCDRDTGMDADGLIVAVACPSGPPALETNGSVPAGSVPGPDGWAARMRLWNSDGSEAAVSGNCLRCLTHALARYWNRSDLEIWVGTSVGPRWCSVRAAGEANMSRGVVEMKIEASSANPTPELTTADPTVAVAAFVGIGGVERWDTVDVGNPHAVLAVAEPDDVQLEKAGPAVEALFLGGINVHFAFLTGRDEVTIGIWERGAGATDACGTGAVAVAEVFRRWNLVGNNVMVRMPGGDAVAEFATGDSAGSEQLVRLTGPSMYVDTIVRDHALDHAGLGSGLG